MDIRYHRCGTHTESHTVVEILTRTLSVVWLVVAVISPGRAESAERLAVLEFTSDGSVTDSELGFIADRVRGEALKVLDDDEWKVMTRENMLVLIGANADQLEACIGECEVETGRLLGADRVVSGSAMVFGTRYTVMLKVYETESGELLATQELTAADLDELWDGIPKASATLFGDPDADHGPARADPLVVTSSVPSSNPLDWLNRPTAMPASSPRHIEMLGRNRFSVDGSVTSWRYTRPALKANIASVVYAKQAHTALWVGIIGLIAGALYTPGGIAYLAETGADQTGVLFISFGAGWLTAGIILLATDKMRKKKAVDAYNASMQTALRAPPNY